MFDFQIGVGRISLRLRHAHSLKDKRKVMQSLVTKMRNLGCSVTEADYQDSPKIGSIGFAFAGSSASQVEDRFSQVGHLLLGDFEVLSYDKEFLGYDEEIDEDSDASEDPEDENILDDKDPD